MAKQNRAPYGVDDDAEVLGEGAYARGQRHGGWLLRYRSGEVRARVVINRIAQRPLDVLYPDGSKAAQGCYACGAENGLWIYWSEDGDELVRGRYAKG